MEIKLNFPENDNYISNLAFIKALMIKTIIEKLDINYEEKERLRESILETLKKAWKNIKQELESQLKRRCRYHEKENSNSYICKTIKIL